MLVCNMDLSFSNVPGTGYHMLNLAFAFDAIGSSRSPSTDVSGEDLKLKNADQKRRNFCLFCSYHTVGKLP
jgi:hypothetical protein